MRAERIKCRTCGRRVSERVAVCGECRVCSALSTRRAREIIVRSTEEFVRAGHPWFRHY